ncbi:MAG: peptidylprolyl isomerase, partial [Fidelibacterota bacterium]
MIGYKKRVHCISTRSAGMLFGLILLFTIIQGCGEEDIQYLAGVGDRVVTADRFRARLKRFLELNSLRDNLVIRRNLLNTMVNEYLLLIEAQRLGIKKDPEYRYMVKSIEKQVLLDALRRNVVYDTVTVNEDEIKKFFIRMNQKISARHLYAGTEDEAYDLLNRLKGGSSFEELAEMTFRDSILASTGGYLGYFGIGEMDPAFEKKAFSLKVGEISEPVKTTYGYSIIKVEDKISIPVVTEYEYYKEREKLREIIKGEKSIEAAKRLVFQLAEQMSIEFQPRVIEFLMKEIERGKESSFFKINREEAGINDPFKYILNRELVRFKGGRWTVADFLKEARFTSGRQRNRIENPEQLKRFIKGLIVRQALLEMAEKRGLHKLEEVRKEVEKNVERYIIERMREMIV